MRTHLLISNRPFGQKFKEDSSIESLVTKNLPIK